MGDVLVVGLNSDQSIKSIKGNDRPIHNQDFRLIMLQALKPVDAVVIFDEDTPVNVIQAEAASMLKAATMLPSHCQNMTL